MELQVIAATVIGGANLAGGIGTAFGALVGSALIEVIRNSLDLLGISAFWQGAFVGCFIIIAVAFDRTRTFSASDSVHLYTMPASLYGRALDAVRLGRLAYHCA